MERPTYFGAVIWPIHHTSFLALRLTESSRVYFLESRYHFPEMGKNLKVARRGSALRPRIPYYVVSEKPFHISGLTLLKNKN